MRCYLCCLLLAALPVWLNAQLSGLDTTSALEIFEPELERYMTESNNKRAREAYANFTGTFYGGGLTVEQQRRIVATSTALSTARAKADKGMADYLDLQQYLAGGDKEKQLLFKEFHDVLGKTLGEPEFSIARINDMLSNALNYLSDGRLDGREGESGWKVAGGKPHFIYTTEPIMRIDTVQRLMATTRGDTLTIQETQLFVNLAGNSVTGKGGRTDWQRVGLPSDIFVRLVDYQFQTDRQLLTSDSAQFQYPHYFGDRILYGSFKDRLQSGGPRVNGDVPEFISTNGFIDINNIGEGMRLNGQFELRASRVYAVGDEDRGAVVSLQIADGADERKVTGTGKQFVVQNGERITGQETDLTIYFGEDSLYHPSVSIDVDVPARKLELRRGASSAERLPFYHSGNRFNIDADNITVYLAGDSAVVGRRTASFQEKGDVNFESVNYFNDRDYARIQALAGFNPLEVIYKFRYSVDGGSDTISLSALAGRFDTGLRGKDLESVIFDLQDRGFLTYDGTKGVIYLKPKLEHYVLSHREAKDFDRLQLVSRTPVTNAFIDLQGGTIRVDGVQPLQLNRDKKVAIKPFNEQVSIVGDRDFDFGGQVFAGAAILSGKDFHFKYEPYYIQFDSVSYIDLFLPEGGEVREDARLLSTASRIENVSGYVLLDAPKNKSGAENIPYFPSLQTRGPSYIYYDRADTASLYSRDSFYFELAPFSLNNLDSVTEFNLGLEGQLVSGGIFPDMKQRLAIQEDGSLGFVGATDSLTSATYGGRGSYAGELTLDNDGLVGRGKLTFLEAEIEGEEIRFGVDSTTTTAESFVLNRSVSGQRAVPHVEGARVKVTFRPYGDSLIVTPEPGEQFQLFGSDDKNFDGRLVLRPEALEGSGTLSWPEAAIRSDYFKFGADQAMADTAVVAINSQQDPDEVALRTKGAAASVDFVKGTASFVSSDSGLVTELPYLEFVTSSDRFDWDLNTGNITFNTRRGKDRFTSVNPDQDSLSFVVATAEYDNISSELRAGGVPFIISADAKIFSSDSTLIVQPGGKIAQLTNARIVADTINAYHVINRATVDIAGRKEYTASGFYEYNVRGHQQEFELQNIVGTRVGKGLRSDKETATRAEGEIAETTEFYIDDKTRFYGTIELDAGSAELAFDGYARIEAEKLPSAEWFVVQSPGDKNNLILNTQRAKGVDGKPLVSGFYLSKTERHVYPALIQSPERRVDPPILDASGVFTYDEERDAFLFGDSSRVADPSAVIGNLMTFDHAAGQLSGDGLLGIGSRLKYINFNSYGTVEMELPEQFAREAEPDMADAAAEVDDAEPTDTTAAPKSLTDNMFLLEEETKEPPVVNATTAGDPEQVQAPTNYPETRVELMATLDLILTPRLVQIMATDLVSGGYSAPQLAVNQKIAFADAGLRNLFPAGPDLERAITGLPADAIDLPPTLNNHTFLFSDLRMQWNTDYQSFVTTNSSNGIASVGGQSLNRRIQSYLEVKMTTGGDDRLYLYLKSPSETYYFFGYKDGILNVVSSNNSFMNELRETNPKDLVLEMEDGQTYEILEVTPGTAAAFLRRVESAFPAN